MDFLSLIKRSLFSTTIIVAFSCSNDEGFDCLAGGLITTISTITNASCGLNNGSVNLSVSNGKSPYMYSLSGTDFKMLPASNATIEAVAPGIYDLTIRDAEGCEANASISISNKNNLTSNIAVTISGCGTADGSIAFEVTGGEEPYLYSLDGAVQQTDPIFSGLTPGEYQALIVDQNGCETNTSISLISGTSYKDEIIPIIEASCAIADCHDGSNTALPDWTQYANVEALAETIKRRTTNKTMPPTGSPGLSSVEIQAIACWVDDGALNN